MKRVVFVCFENANRSRYDLTTHHSKSLAGVGDLEFDAAVTMGCGDQCDAERQAAHRLQNPDSRAMPPDEFRSVRELIEAKVIALLEELRV